MQDHEMEQNIPRLGFGTYGRRGAEGVDAILCALDVGYRHIDTAQSYGTEAEVGESLRQSGLKRADVFVTTKIDMANFGDGLLGPSLERSLADMQLEQVDLTLIHWPSPNGSLPLALYLEQLAVAQGRGLTRLIGVSNFPIAMLIEAEGVLGKGIIATNQFELNPLFQNRKLADYCKANGILVTCYQPIRQGRVAGDPVLSRIAAWHGATPEQVALGWELAQGYAAIPTSSRADRIRSNFGALAITLTEQDMRDIDAIAQGPRSINPDWGPKWD